VAQFLRHGVKGTEENNIGLKVPSRMSANFRLKRSKLSQADGQSVC